jgi:hypothetical protein
MHPPARCPCFLPALEPLEPRLFLSGAADGSENPPESPDGLTVLAPAEGGGAGVALPGAADPSTSSLSAPLDFAVAAVSNSPIGIARGIFPGRVAWVYNPNAAKWTGSGNYWAPSVNPQAEYDKAFTAGIICLSGGSSEADGWDRIFKWFNNDHGRPGTGYQPGDKIAIKINQNNTPWSGADHGNNINANPQSALACVRSLVNAGVPQGDIWIGDPSRAVTDNVFNAIHNAYPNVNVVDYFGNNGRVTTGVTGGAFPNSYGFPNAQCTCFYNARYIIDMPLMKGHGDPCVTFGAKNFYGSMGIYNDWTKNSPHPEISDNSMAAIMTNGNFGGKVVLWCMDAMYPTYELDQTPVLNWSESPFNGKPVSSFIMSLDGCAEESVSLDFFQSHYGGGWSDGYMRIAASNGAGVAEHWNNATDRQYSRNLGTGKGIELIPVTLSASGGR